MHFRKWLCLYKKTNNVTKKKYHPNEAVKNISFLNAYNHNLPSYLIFGKDPIKDCKKPKVKLKIKLIIIIIIVAVIIIIFSKEITAKY